MIKFGNTEIYSIEEIQKENEEFSYTEFFKEHYPIYSTGFGAVGVITSNQFINIKNLGNGKGPHNQTIGNINMYLNHQIYKEISSYKNKVAIMSANAYTLPNIYIRMVNESTRLIMISIPDKITRNQYNMLVAYFNHYKEEILSLEDVELVTTLGDKDEYTIDEIIELASQIVDDSYEDEEDENIIGIIPQNKPKKK